MTQAEAEEMVALEEADAEENTGKVKAAVPESEDDIEVDETLEDDDDDDSTFIADDEEGDEDVTDIIGDVGGDERAPAERGDVVPLHVRLDLEAVGEAVWRALPTR